MPLLLVFAFLSGLITITAPCIWPLLPIVLSSAQKPLRLIAGLTISFFLSTLLVSAIVKIVPFNAIYLRYFAIVVIGISGLTLLIPKLAAILETALGKLTNRFSPQGNGGLVTGIALGLVWAPCAGPILATVTVLAATQKLTLDTVLILIFYTIGVALSLWVFTLVGRKFVKNTQLVQKIFGVIMIVTAAAMIFNYDTLIEAKLLNLFPGYSNFTAKLESIPLKAQSNSGTAPEFTGITNWLNSKPLTMADLRGKVVLVDFWTYTCINCIRTLPYVASWYNKYKDQGFVVVGVHTPEFEFEKNTQNVADALKRFGITYPVAQDNNYGTWNAYANQYWPADYLINQQGQIVDTHFGEGDYAATEQKIRDLLKITGTTTTAADNTPTGDITPETYLGNARGGAPYVTLNNNWQAADEYIQSKGNATLDLEFTAQKVFLVITPKSHESLKLSLDGKPQPDIQLDTPRLYQLENLKGIETHKLHLEFAPGTQAFAFTFG